MQKGLLSGKVTQAWVDALPATDHRRGDPQFNEPLLSRNIALNGGLRTLAARLGTTPIVGARKPGQIAETLGGGRLTIPTDALQEIEGLLK